MVAINQEKIEDAGEILSSPFCFAQLRP